MMSRQWVAVGLLLVPALAWSANGAEAPPPPPPPEDIPDDVSADGGVVDPESETLKPEVTIIRRDGEVLEEYRINGVLYKVKVTPRRGPPYYLLYPDGPQGPPVRRELGDLQTPHWVIFSW